MVNYLINYDCDFLFKRVGMFMLIYWVILVIELWELLF